MSIIVKNTVLQNCRKGNILSPPKFMSLVRKTRKELSYHVGGKQSNKFDKRINFPSC